MPLLRPHDFKVIVAGERRREYVVRAERSLGHALPRKACVHHYTEQQLVICQDLAYHKLLHVRTRVLRAGGNPNTQKVCGHCKRVKDVGEFSPWVNGKLSAVCKPCRSAYEGQRRTLRMKTRGTK